VSSRREKALEAALKYATRGQHEKAAREYQVVVDDDPKDLRSWLLLADCLQKSGQTDKAVARYLQVARTFGDDGQNEKALAVYRQVLAIDPERMDVYLKCAQLYRNLRRTAEAVDAYETVAQACLRRGNAKDAMALYRSVVELEPTSVNRRLRLAELYSREKMTDQAVAEFRLCAEQLRNEGQDAQFVRVAERLLFHAPDREILRQLVDVYNHTGESRRALIKLNEVLQNNPTDLEGLEMLGSTFIAVGKPDKALSVISELVRHAKNADSIGKAIAIRAVRMGLAAMPGQPDLEQALLRLGASREELSDTAMIADDEIEDIDAQLEDSGILEPLDDDHEYSDVSEVEAVEDLQEFDELRSVDDGMNEEVSEPEEDEVSSTVVWNAKNHTKISQRQSDRRTNEAEPRRSPSPRERRAAPAPLSAELEQQIEEARVLVKYRLFDYADSHLDPILAKIPDHPRILELKAELLQESGRDSQAHEWRIRLAGILFEQGGEAASRAQIEKVLAKDPGHPAAKRFTARFEARPTPEPTSPPKSATEVTQDRRTESPFDDDFTISIDTGTKAPEVEEEPVDEDRFGLGDDDEAASDSSHEVPPPLPPAGFDRVEDSGPITLGDLNLPTDDPIALQHAPSSVEPAADISEEWVVSPPSLESSPALDFGDLDLPPRANESAPAHQHEPVLELAAQKEAPQWPDISIDLGELDFFLVEELHDDAREFFRELTARYPGHPALLPYRARVPEGEAEPLSRAVSDPASEVATPTSVAAHVSPLVAESGDRPVQVDQWLSDEDADMALAFLEDAAAPLIEVDAPGPTLGAASAPAATEPVIASGITDEDDDEDAYLSSIFEGGGNSRKTAAGVAARSEITEQEPSALFDLGLAYREMAMNEAAIEALVASGADPEFAARSSVILAELYRNSGALADALSAAEKALNAAASDDELQAARYERALALLDMSLTEAALADFECLPSGWRDVDARVAALREMLA
jgi:tetratricopeptide (TPR) repeat protein